MKKVRTLKSQMNYLINDNVKIGQSKRVDRMNKAKDFEANLYSNDRTENMRTFTIQIAIYIKAEYPDLKRVADIKHEHVQSFIDKNQSNWSSRTCREYISRFRKMETMIQKTYSRKCSFAKDLHYQSKEHELRTRDVKMDHNDIDKLKTIATSEREQRILEVSERVGTRAKELSYLKAERINLDKNVIEIRIGGKNDLHRDIPIRSKDLQYFKDLKAEMLEKGQTYITGGVTEDTLNKDIRELINKADLSEKYVNTTIHAIRKTYATDRMEELRGPYILGSKALEMKAWDQVSKELGHGEDRLDQYKAYVKT